MKKWRLSCRSPVWVKIGKIIYSSLFLIGLFLSGQSVYADEPVAPSITLTVEQPETLEVIPGEFNSASHTVEVSTNNDGGYVLTLENSNDTTDIVSTDGQIRIPTIPNQTTISNFPVGYGYSVNGTTYLPIPVRGVSDIVGFSSSATGVTPDSYELTFGAKVDIETPAGEYRKVLTLTATANDTIVCTVNSICYMGNGDDNTGEMTEQPTEGASEVVLRAPNYSRPGYGFAGWNTMPNGSGTTYGPNETIAVGDLSEGGLVLYAKWIASAGTMQGWSGCQGMTIGAVTALTDSRDDSTYAVAKLADGECWTIENLRLDLSKNDVVINANNTHNPTAEFMTAANAHPASTNTFCNLARSSCIDHIYFNTNNTNRSLPDSYNAEGAGVSWYSYGNYYNWYTATAGNGGYNKSNPDDEIQGDICPAGWYLPTANGTFGSFANLDISLGGNGSNNNSVAMSKKWRSYPNNFMYSGQWVETLANRRSESGNYQSTSIINNTSAANLWLQPNKVSANSNGTYKYRGQTVRCLVDNSYTIVFDKNLNWTVNGTMKNRKAVVGSSTRLPANTYSAETSSNRGYRFIGWNTRADGSGDSYADEATVPSLTSTVGASVTLYAQWQEIAYADVTVAFTTGVTRVTLANDTYGSYDVTIGNSVVSLAINQTYQISMEYETEYDLVGWSTTANGTLGSVSASPTTYVVSGTATLAAEVEERVGAFYLQNVTASSCSTTPKTAIDIRDNQEYSIQRLADGNCWMLDNLRLGAATIVEPFSVSNTNMSPNVAFSLPASGLVDDYANPRFDSSEVDNLPTSAGGVGTGKMGVRYNYCAASAGTVCTRSSKVNSEYDICPAGWTLPNGDPTNGALAVLYAAYNNNYGNLNTALSLPYTGYWNAATSGVADLNKYGYYWTTTGYNNNKSYAIEPSRNSNKVNGAVRNNGLGIRCVLK